jgi:hypothetical protein
LLGLYKSKETIERELENYGVAVWWITQKNKQSN